MTKRYEGICRGGPTDGCWRVAEATEVRIPILSPISLRQADAPPDAIVECKWGTYKYVANNWVWRDDAHG